MVDLSQVTKLSLDSFYLPSFDRIRYYRFIDLLKQTSNLHSLTIGLRLNTICDPFVVEKVCFRIIAFLDRSNLRHLNIPIFNLDQIKIILDRFTNLFSLTLCLSTGSINSKQILDYFQTSWHGCSIVTHQEFISIWFNEGSNKNSINNDRKRMKLSH